MWLRSMVHLVEYVEKVGNGMRWSTWSMKEQRYGTVWHGVEYIDYARVMVWYGMIWGGVCGVWWSKWRIE